MSEDEREAFFQSQPPAESRNNYRDGSFMALLNHGNIVMTYRDVLFAVLGDAFGFTIEELESLDGTTTLQWLYERFSPRWGDSMEFETLKLELEHELGRSLSENERNSLETICDVEALLKSEGRSTSEESK